MEWWAALLVAGVPAVITSVSLIVQQRFNTRAAEKADESRRIDAEAERKHQERLLEVSNTHAREQTEQEHRRQARDAWKADRRAAHTRLLTRLEEIEDRASSVLTSVSYALIFRTDASETDFDLPTLPEGFVADVALVCSDKSADAARQARAKLVALEVSLIALDALIATNTREQTESIVSEAREQLDALREAVSAYRQAAKQDIDTVD